jgi:hypothetical protein
MSSAHYGPALGGATPDKSSDDNSDGYGELFPPTPTGFIVARHSAPSDEQNASDLSVNPGQFDEKVGAKTQPAIAGDNQNNNRTDRGIPYGRIRGRAPVSERAQPHPDERTCAICRGKFHPTIDAVSRGMGFYCSQRCRSRAPRPPSTFRTPESTKAERVRANGLVNMRIRRGAMKRPKACQFCGKVGRVDAHHPDYQQPDLVAFLCRSDHMRCHNDASFEKTVAEKVRLIQVPESKHATAAAGGGR